MQTGSPRSAAQPSAAISASLVGTAAKERAGPPMRQEVYFASGSFSRMTKAMSSPKVGS